MKIRYQQLVDRFDKFQAKFDDMSKSLEEQILIENKRLDESLIEQVNVQYQWERFYASISGLHEEAKTESEKAFSEAYKEAISDSYKSVTATDAKHIATCNDEYYQFKKLENKIYRLKKEVEAVVDLIESRKFILKDLTASIINDCNRYILK